MSVFPVSRRTLLTTLAGGTVAIGATGLWLGIERISRDRFRRPVERPGMFAPSVYLGITPDGGIEIWLTRSEMGQGVSTALPMIVADELDADWSRVSVHQAQATARFDYGQLFTAASSSVASQWIELRRAGATAREMLISAAAARWEVSARDCSTHSSTVVYESSGRRLSYGELADAAALQWVPIRPTLKSADEFNLIGQPIPRRDLEEKVTGKSVYGTDVSLPGMLRAVVLRAPVFGAELHSFDDAAARALPGVVEIVRIPSGIAVIAETTPEAIHARNRISADWRGAEALSNASIQEELRTILSRRPGRVGSEQGDVESAWSRAVRVQEATFEAPYLAHACMEPMNCTVSIDGSHCSLWVPSQAPEGARDSAARILGLPVENVEVNVTQLGGGFGRRTGQDFVAEAVEIARQVKQPVQLLWTREDDLAHGSYRDAAAMTLRAGLDESGLPLVLDHYVCSAMPGPESAEMPMGPMMGSADVAYQIPAHRMRHASMEAPVPVTIWRSVGYSYNTFALECFVDELADQAEIDPLDYRLKMLPENRSLVACTTRVAELARWQTRQVDGRHLGLAVYDFSGTAVAMVAEVELVDLGWKVRGIWCAVDCGTVVNPDTVRAQIEGGIVFGFSAARYEALEIRSNSVTSRNFDKYRLARMSDCREIVVALMPSERHPSGVGEASVPLVAPAIVNALFQATGIRHRKLPLNA